jgi:TolB protein
MAQHDLQFRSVADDRMSGGWSRRSLIGAGATLMGIAAAPRHLAAQLRVDITRGTVAPIPIAISRFAGTARSTGDLGRSIPELVTANLQSSGLFRVIDPAAYIQSPEELRDVPRFADWRQINAQALVSGSVAPGPQGASVEFRLWDVFAGSQLRGLRYDFSQDQWRRIGHKISDVVYERMTGEGGYFDTRIVYISETGPAARRVKRVAIMDQDGANHRFLTDGSNLVLTPHISPDSRLVAHIEYRGLQPRVYLRDIAGGAARAVEGIDGLTFSPRFSPDGATLLVTAADRGNSDIFAVPTGGGPARRLTDSPAIDTSPSFSPDGARICFNSDRGGTPQLYVMGRGGGAAQRISYGDGRYGSPAWSPRGDLVAFTNIKGGAFHIGVMRPDGSDERLLTRSRLDQGPAWAPNGRIILFTRQDRGGGSRLMTIDVSGYNERNLPTPLDASDPDWSRLIP